jgi:PAS domain S-box-containing protein
MQALIDFFGVKDFIPHGYCLAWNPALLWTTVLSNAILALAYSIYPIAISYFVWKRKDLQYRWLYLSFFNGFILTCGGTHLFKVVTVWLPLYWLSAYVDALAAAVAVATVFAIWRVIPQALNLPSPAELRVQRSAAQYARSLIEASLDPLVTISPAGKITDVNQSTEHATGRSRRELIGTDFSDYFTEPDKAREGYQQVLREGSVTDYPLALRQVSGKVMEVLYNASVYRDEKSEVAGVFAAARDITERKKAEQEAVQLSLRNQLILDSAGEGIYGLDIDGRCTFVNPAASQMLGFTVDELDGRHSHSMFHHSKPDGSPYPQEECPVLAAYKQGAVHRGGDMYWRKDGSSFPVEFISTPIMEAGKITGAVVAFRDITDSKRAEEELRKYHEQLEELVRERTGQLEAANKDLEGFAYSVSHDLRVPLRAIDGFSQQVLKHYADKLDDEGKRYLNVVRDNTKKMSQLIDDILAFSRMGRLGLSVSEVNMEELAQGVFEELKPTLAGRELTIEIKPLPLCHGDPSMLRQVLVNLLGNAIKFTRPRDTALVEVGGHVEGAEIIYYVKDNGAGFDMQYADKLFGVFQRLHGVAEFEGTGIGLAIVKRIVTRHGGRIWAEGKVDEGATFYFTLPD